MLLSLSSLPKTADRQALRAGEGFQRVVNALRFARRESRYHPTFSGGTASTRFLVQNLSRQAVILGNMTKVKKELLKSATPKSPLSGRRQPRAGTVPAETTQLDEDAISAIVGSLKQGDFSKEVQHKLDDLWNEIKQKGDRNRHYYKIAAMVSEVNYHLDRPERAKAAVADGGVLLRELHSAGISVDRKLLKEQIRYCQDYIQVACYYPHQYEDALRFLGQCREVVMKWLRSSYGTRAQNSYYVGKSKRQMNDYDGAEKSFRDAIKKYGRRAHSRRDLPREAKLAECAFIARRVAITLGLGLGWLDYTRGRLAAAYEKVNTAKAVLSAHGDDLNIAYLDLMCGSIWRCQAGTDFQRRHLLRKARSTVTEALVTFESFQHRRYQARATYELGLIDLALADPDNALNEFGDRLDRARKHAEAVRRQATATGSWRWVSNALILLSRIERKDADVVLAEKLAQKALDLAKKHEQVLCQIDARIARAEARLILAEEEIQHRDEKYNEKSPDSLVGARRDLEKAQALNRTSETRTSENQNLKIEAVCSLNLAKSFLLEGQLAIAESSLPPQQDVGKIEHIDIQNFNAEIKNKINLAKAKPFNIPWNVPDLTFKEHDLELKRFLLACAWQRGARNQAQLAKTLGVDRHTMREWLKAVRE